MIWIITKLHRKVKKDYPIIRGVVLIIVGVLLFISGINF